MLDLTEEALDQIAVFIDDGVKAAPCGGSGSARNDGFCTSCGDGIHGALAVITFVSQNMARFQPVEERLNLGNVIAFSARQDEANGIAKRIGGSMNLGAQATF